jgi:hypothetical protein
MMIRPNAPREDYTVNGAEAIGYPPHQAEDGQTAVYDLLPLGEEIIDKMHRYLLIGKIPFPVPMSLANYTSGDLDSELREEIQTKRIEHGPWTFTTNVYVYAGRLLTNQALGGEEPGNHRGYCVFEGQLEIDKDQDVAVEGVGTSTGMGWVRILELKLDQPDMPALMSAAGIVPVGSTSPQALSKWSSIAHIAGYYPADHEQSSSPPAADERLYGPARAVRRTLRETVAETGLYPTPEGELRAF